ncbi:MAG TPA: hypothetical protein VGO17_05875 [Aurantimonas sp.]|nr:hypothetical protein [Aurantimonas sp.]
MVPAGGSACGGLRLQRIGGRYQPFPPDTGQKDDLAHSPGCVGGRATLLAAASLGPKGDDLAHACILLVLAMPLLPLRKRHGDR